MIRRAAGLLALALLIGCAGPQINSYMLSSLDKGMSAEAVKAKFQQQPLAVQVGRSASRMIEFQRYQMNNGVQLDSYLLAFENNRLLYWGYVSEFRRLQDPELNAALSDALTKFYKPR